MFNELYKSYFEMDKVGKHSQSSPSAPPSFIRSRLESSGAIRNHPESSGVGVIRRHSITESESTEDDRCNVFVVRHEIMPFRL